MIGETAKSSSFQRTEGGVGFFVWRGNHQICCHISEMGLRRIAANSGDFEGAPIQVLFERYGQRAERIAREKLSDGRINAGNIYVLNDDVKAWH